MCIRDRKILSEEMRRAAALKVDLEIDMHDGKNWFEMCIRDRPDPLFRAVKKGTG